MSFILNENKKKMKKQKKRETKQCLPMDTPTVTGKNNYNDYGKLCRMIYPCHGPRSVVFI